MFTYPKSATAVRSNCLPAVTLKSAVNTIFFHGPGQFAGGVNGKLWMLKFTNWKPENSCTTHGVSWDEAPAGRQLPCWTNRSLPVGFGRTHSESSKATKQR